MKNTKLIFVYNSTLNPASLAADFIHGIFPQQDPKCSLCNLTYSLVFQKREWKDFVETLPCTTSFMLRDMFVMKYGKEYKGIFPAVFIQQNLSSPKIECIITAEQINAVKSLDELKVLVTSALAQNVTGAGATPVSVA